MAAGERHIVRPARIGWRNTPDDPDSLPAGWRSTNHLLFSFRAGEQPPNFRLRSGSGAVKPQAKRAGPAQSRAIASSGMNDPDPEGFVFSNPVFLGSRCRFSWRFEARARSQTRKMALIMRLAAPVRAVCAPKPFP